jgi:hypothetical protein
VPHPPPLSTIAAVSANAPQGVRSASVQSAGKSFAFREEYQAARSPFQSSFRPPDEELTLATSVNSSHAGLPKGHSVLQLRYKHFEFLFTHVVHALAVHAADNPLDWFADQC